MQPKTASAVLQPVNSLRCLKLHVTGLNLSGVWSRGGLVPTPTPAPTPGSLSTPTPAPTPTRTPGSIRHVPGSQPPFSLVPVPDQNKEDTSCISVAAYCAYIPFHLQFNYVLYQTKNR